MGNAKVFARDRIVKVPRQRLARRVSDGVDDAIEAIPRFSKLRKQCGNLLVAGDIAGKDQVRAKFRRHFFHPFAHAFTLVGKRQFRSFAMHGLGDAVGNRTVAQQAGDQNPLVRQHSHALTFTS